ncbi:hypothetical protein [Campylobacter sp.]|uniref:hypothetical protein n=1 Tax=Campylobacter sp. TaxID=205 RepID=UPI002A803F2B|nr:hypothetical protein [Campylobacter sp.]MCI7237535.1 hypothetical protein [Campylobacter sp.]MDY4802713.1 hypothetical protein [Campylobacter sp.]MDY4829513.1 hypothetical protein [Campylobacter sp.]
MNENKMLNDKPIFVAKRRIFRGLILAAIGLMFALVIYSVAQEPEVGKLKQVVGWCGVVMLGASGVFGLYVTLMFKKIMLFDDRIEVHFVNKVIVRTYSQIKRCYFYENRFDDKRLVLECEPKFIHNYLNSIFLHKNELYKIKEILIKKGVKDNSDGSF